MQWQFDGKPAHLQPAMTVLWWLLLHSQLEGGLEDMGGLLRKRGCREMDANCIPDQMNHAMFALADISPPGAFGQDNSMLAHGLLLIFTLP